MDVRLIEGDAVFTELADCWNDLARSGMTNSPFQQLAYQAAWWRHLHPETAVLLTLVVIGKGTLPEAIACFYLHDGTLFFNGCVEETDYLDLICRSEVAESAWTAVFERLISPDFPSWQTIDLCNIPEMSPTRAILPKLAKAHGLSISEEVHEVCPVIRLPESFDDYLDALGSKQKREIRRKLRRAAGAEAKTIVVSPEADVATAVDEFLALLQKSTLEKGAWLTEGRRALFHDTAKAAVETNSLQLMFVEVEGRRAAGLFNFDYDGRIWVYNSGLEPNTFGSLSLGVVLTARAIEIAIENGRHEFDFLRGNETYKYRFGAEDTRVYRLHISRNE